jgi:hypothetical protein
MGVDTTVHSSGRVVLPTQAAIPLGFAPYPHATVTSSENPLSEEALMSQNGPPWSRGESDEPYTEPADPWGDQGAPAAAPDPSWGMPAYQPPPPSDSMWVPPPAPPRRRNTPMVALVVTLGLLIVVGLGATAWLLKERDNKPTGQAEPSAVATREPGPAPMGSEDARFFAKKGDCVTNEGTDAKPKMRTIACASGTYKVLERITKKTSGEADAEQKCAKVKGYTKWYFFDSQLDDLDFVLCLKEYEPV